MSDRLDQTCRLPAGTRDAVHVPIVAGRWARNDFTSELKPGEFVKFVDDKFVDFVPCQKDEAHGVANPFLDVISHIDPVIILLFPGITTPVRHDFNIDLNKNLIEKEMLKFEVEQARKEDPGCAGCWIIHNNEVIRL